jgi:hypothetical protein
MAIQRRNLDLLYEDFAYAFQVNFCSLVSVFTVILNYYREVMMLGLQHIAIASSSLTINVYSQLLMIWSNAKVVVF